MINFLKRRWQNRWLRGFVWTAVSLVTLCALLDAGVNWSGARRWNATLAMLQSQGETVDFRALTSDPIPDAENFCAIPLLKDLSLAADKATNEDAPKANRKRLEALKLPWNGKGVPPRFTNALLGKNIDLAAWAAWLRQNGSPTIGADSGDPAREVLAMLSKDDAVVQELIAGLDREGAQWTPAWRTRELAEPLISTALLQYSAVQGLNQTLALRAIAAARMGDAARAHESALVIARLNQASLEDPILIGQLVCAAGVSALHGVTWELCDAHAGTAENFTKLESALVRLDFHRGLLQACRGELAVGVNAAQFFRRLRDHAADLFQAANAGSPAAPSAVFNLAMRAIPSGLFDANAAVLADREFHYLIKPLKEPGWHGALQSAQDWDKEVLETKKSLWTHPSYVVTSIIAPASNSIVSRVIFTQALVNQAVIACALERYRIEKGGYPDSLDGVTQADGKPSPLDVINGEPMHYRKTADGRYALWSVGFDGKDDGGRRVLDGKRPENTKFSDPGYIGDWVWDFPAAMPSTHQ